MACEISIDGNHVYINDFSTKNMEIINYFKDIPEEPLRTAINVRTFYIMPIIFYLNLNKMKYLE